MNLIACFFYHLMVLAFRLVPFQLVYWVADFFVFLFADVVKYRKKVVVENLTNSFPDKTNKEIQQITKEVYRNIADIFVEVFKTPALSPQQIQKRFSFQNLELIQKLYDNKENIILTAGHINNWEWGPHPILLHTPYTHMTLYQKLSNNCVEKHLTGKIRQKYGGLMLPVSQTKEMFETKEKGVMFVLGADQSPSSTKHGVWINFLNQPTLFLHGPEKYREKYNLTVVHLHIQRKKRGHYHLHFKLLADKTEQLQPNELTLRYARELEKEIMQSPGSWLWTHKRWKKKPLEEDIILQIKP